jgi:hypothetical protein
MRDPRPGPKRDTMMSKLDSIGAEDRQRCMLALLRSGEGSSARTRELPFTARLAIRTRRNSAPSTSRRSRRTHRGAPPDRPDRSNVDGRSPGLRLDALLSAFPGQRPSGFGRKLAAYSCGGSRGLGPRSLFTSRTRHRHRNGRPLRCGLQQTCRQVSFRRERTRTCVADGTHRLASAAPFDPAR